MKIGKIYEDKNTGELFMCDNFTRSYYYWINVNGECIEEDKWQAHEHINGWACTDKKRVKAFLENLNYNVRGLCYSCNKTYLSRFKKYINEIACGDEYCPVCGNTLKY